MSGGGLLRRAAEVNEETLSIALTFAFTGALNAAVLRLRYPMASQAAAHPQTEDAFVPVAFHGEAVRK